MAMTKCVECKKEISSDAKVCPHCGKKNPTVTSAQSALGFIILAVIVYWLWSSFGGSSKTEQSSSSSSSSQETVSIIYPESQANFHSINAPFPSQYENGSNEIQKSKVFNLCNATRTKSAKQFKYRIKDWVGKITNITTDQGGDNAFIEIESETSGFTITYRTINNTFSDIGTGSALKKGTKVYNQVGELSRGALVKFSGKFVQDDERGLKETSMTERGCVTSPELVVLFDNIVPY